MAMVLVRQGIQRAGVDVRKPTRGGVAKLAEYLAQVGSEFRATGTLSLEIHSECDMISKTKVSKGHLTVVPKHIRKSLGVREGDVLEWTTDGRQAVVRPRKRRTVDDITAIFAVGGDAARDKKRLARGKL